jgi:hypothetical protein
LRCGGPDRTAKELRALEILLGCFGRAYFFLIRTNYGSRAVDEVGKHNLASFATKADCEFEFMPVEGRDAKREALDAVGVARPRAACEALRLRHC